MSIQTPQSSLRFNGLHSFKPPNIPYLYVATIATGKENIAKYLLKKNSTREFLAYLPLITTESCSCKNTVLTSQFSCARSTRVFLIDK